MNMFGAGKHVALFALGVLLLVLMPVGLCGCREENGSSNAQEQATAEQMEKTVAAKKDDLIGSDGKIKLRILLTTSPKEGRTADFVSFLSKRFVKVQTTDYESFPEEQAEDFDVVIFDYGTTRSSGTPVPELSPAYSRATVTFGVPGSRVCRKLRLKPDYL